MNRKYKTKPYLNDIDLKYNEYNIIDTNLNNDIYNNIQKEYFKLNDSILIDKDPDIKYDINIDNIKKMIDTDNNNLIIKNSNCEINSFNNTNYINKTDNCQNNTNNVDCDNFKNGLDYNKKISTYFILGQLSINAVVSKYMIHDQKGLSKEQIACNLQFLATNVLDKIKIKYPTMFVTSGFRRGYGSSQHYLGMAADIQFKNYSNKDYINIANWIKNNINYDQLLLEYKNRYTKKAWIHISYNSNNNRNIELTLFNNKTYHHTLINLSGKYGIPV